MGASLSCPVYLDNGEFFMNSSNIVSYTFGNITNAFQTPVAINSTAIVGFDWTQPYPGSRKDGHNAYLTVAHELAVSPSIVENATTVLSSLTFDIPSSMSSAGGSQPLPMDPSWYICRHVFITTKPEAKAVVDGGDKKCNFLSQACQADLKTSLTKNWGKAAEGTMCSSLVFDSIPSSCQDSYGFARQDVMGLDAAFLADSSLNTAQTNRDQQRYTWRIGTGYHDPGDARAYELAANRTYLIANVWGYSQSSKSKQVPEVSFGCLSSGAKYVPPPVAPPPSSPSSTKTTSSSTSTTAPTQTSVPNNAAFSEDFSSGSTSQLKSYGGSFDASSKALVGSNSAGGKALVNSNFGNFLFEADITLPSSSGNAGLVFRVSNPGSGPDSYNGYYAGIDGTGSVIIGRASNDWTPLGGTPVAIAANVVHHLKVQAVDKTLDIFVDNMSTAKLSVTDSTYTTGMNGVRVYNTGATFDNIQISPLAFSEDFSSDTMAKWTTFDGSYKVTSNVAAVSASNSAKALTTNLSFQNLIITADISIDSTSTGNGGFIFRVSNAAAGADSYNGYYAGIGNGFVVLGRADNNWNELYNFQGADIKLGQKHRLMVRTSGDLISVFVDDLNTPRIVVRDGKYTSGSSGLRAYSTTMSVSNLQIYRG